MERTGTEVPLIITVAPTGAEVTREQNPHVPYTPEEIAEEVQRSFEAGAAMCHLHVRKMDGTPSADVAVWQDTVARVRAACPGMIIMVSTGGAVTMSEDERLRALGANPDMASLTTGTTNFGDHVFYNPMPLVRRFAARMAEQDIQPEIEIFDIGMIANAERLAREGVVREPLHFNIILGVPGALPATPAHLMYAVSTLPEDASWCAAAVGRAQRQIVALAIGLGGHVRVGFEDNVKLTRTTLAESNADFVAAAAEISRTHGRSIASPEQARTLLGVRTNPVDKGSRKIADASVGGGHDG